MKRIIFLIISFAFIASFETEAQIASTNKVFDWHPEAGENGIEAKIRFKCKYDSYFQEPTVIKTAKATKGNTIYYEGETYTKDKIGERAWNQIDITDISVSFDIYDGRRHICTITYDNLVSYDVAGSPEWGETLQSCLDAESEKELFKKGFSIRNVRLVNAKAIGMGGVAKYVRKKKRDEKYKRIIAEADSYFSSSSYQSAIEKYKEASNVKPEEEYPEDKIDQIQSLLEEKKIDSYYANEEMENEEMGNEEKNKNSDEKYDYQKNSDVNYTSTKNQGYEQYKYLSNELNEIEEYGEKLEQTLTNNAILLANAIEALSSNNRASQRSKWKRIYYNRDIAKEKSRESRINIGKNEYLGFINGKSYGHVYLWDGLKDCSFINELPYAPTTSSLKYFKAKKELGGAIKKPNYYLKIKNRKKIELYYNYFPKND